jgi:plastocyanin
MRRTAAITIAAVAAAAATGVSAHAVAGDRAAATTLKLKAAADGDNRFNKQRLTAERGRVTIRLRNPGASGKPHAVAIEGRGVDKESDVAQPGDRVSVSARLRRGTYRFSCPVSGHAADGMRGTLVVE